MSASEHAHHLVEKTLAAERERHEAAIARAVAEEDGGAQARRGGAPPA